MAKRPAAKKAVEAIVHTADTRTNIPTAEDVPLVSDAQKSPIQVAFARRNPDLDPQLVWRGKEVIDWSDLTVPAPPIYIQEKVRPQAIVADLLRDTARRTADDSDLGLFADQYAHDFNGLPANAERTDFYQYEGNWSNRMILGDSLQVMASLIEREGLRGKVQCVYFDPPYGIKFNSNFQWSTTSRDVKDGNVAHITREPEQVKAFRDTWRDGIHSYLTYLRERLTVARELLTESGSIFVQIGDENVHRVRAVMDEVFGDENFVNLISVIKTAGSSSDYLPSVTDFILWYSKVKPPKYRPLLRIKDGPDTGAAEYRYVIFPDGTRRTASREELASQQIASEGELYRPTQTTSQRPQGDGDLTSFLHEGKEYTPGRGTFKTNISGLSRLSLALQRSFR